MRSFYLVRMSTLGGVGNRMDEKEKEYKNHNDEDNSSEFTSVPDKPGTRSIQLKPFSFVMLIFGLILITAGITFFILTAGDDKVVEVIKPPQQGADREEFNKLYEAYDELEK